MLTGSGFESLTNSFINGFKSIISGLETVYQGFQGFRVFLTL